MEEDRSRLGEPVARGPICPFAWPATAFVVGLAWPLAIAASSLDAALLALCGLGLAAVALRARRHRIVWPALALVGAGLGAAGAVGLDLEPRPGEIAAMARRFPGPGEIRGRILSPPSAVPGRISFDLEATSVRQGGVESQASGLVRVSVRGLPDDGIPVSPWRAGDEIELGGLLRPPRDFATPGVPSRVALLQSRGVRAQVEVKTPRLVRVLVPAPATLLGWVREGVLRSLERHVAGGRRPSSDPDAGAGFEVVPESRAAAVLAAMLVDERALLDEEATRMLSEAGLVHILSISGLHVAIVGGAAWLATGLVTRREGARALVALALTWSYAAVAGLPAPAVRSAVVASVVLLGRLLDREPMPLNSLCLALLVGGVLEPGGIRQPGFQATFAAAAGLLLVAPAIAHRLRPALGRWLAMAIAGSLATELFVLPVTLAWFGRVAWASVLLNLLAIPLAALVLFSGFALALLAPLSAGAAAVVGKFAIGLVELLFAVAEPRGFSWALRLALVPGWLAAAAFALLLLAALPAAGLARVRAITAALGLVVLLWPPPRTVPADGLRLHFLDVGQGDAVVAELPGGDVLLVDAGGFPRSRFDVGDRVVVPFLLARGHRRIRLAVISHAHPDHAAGMLAVLEQLQVKALWLGDDPEQNGLVRALRSRAAARGTAVREVRAGDAEGLGASRLAVLGPPPGREPPAEVENDRSVVLALEGGGRRALLPGDIHAVAEAEVVTAGAGVAGDLLKLAHHGSRTSSSELFLDAVRPRLVVSSCGFDNRFGHPSPEVEERLRLRRIRQLRTDLDGTVTVELGADGHTRFEAQRARFR